MSEQDSKPNTSEDEPSIEEILDSIRQIISEDEDEVVQDSDSPELEQDAPDADVFELTERVDDDLPTDVDDDIAVHVVESVDASQETEIMESLEPDASQAIEVDLTKPSESNPIEVELADSVAQEAAMSPHVANVDDVQNKSSQQEPGDATMDETSPYDMQNSQATDESNLADILTDKAANAALSGFTDLVKKTAVDHSGAVTLEDIVRAELNPLLRAWLDRHLPKIIERLVQEELEKLSRKAIDE